MGVWEKKADCLGNSNFWARIAQLFIEVYYEED